MIANEITTETAYLSRGEWEDDQIFPVGGCHAHFAVCLNGEPTAYFVKETDRDRWLEMQFQRSTPSPESDALAGECAALQHFADVAAGYAEF